VAFNTHPHLGLTLKKEQRYTFTPLLDPHGLLESEILPLMIRFISKILALSM
jgi:hypothetical protein